MNSLTSYIPYKLKENIKSILTAKPFEIFFRPLSGQCRCLLYHSVTEQTPNPNTLNTRLDIAVSVNRFEQQIEYIAKNYECLPLPDVINLLKDNKLPSNSVVITFDDGYKDNLTHALPILKKYQVPETIYITTGLISQTAQLWWLEKENIINELDKLELMWEGKLRQFDISTYSNKVSTYIMLNQYFKSINLEQQNELMRSMRNQARLNYCYKDEILTWDEVKALDNDPLITIGAHTHNHPVLSKLTLKDLEKEITYSRKLLENKLKHPVEHFSYPFGSLREANSREFMAVQSAGFKSAVTTQLGQIHQKHAQLLYSLPRLCIGYDDNIKDFKFKLSGINEILS